MENTMQILNKSIRKKYAIEIDKDNLTRLINLINEYYPENTPQIRAVLKDNREVEFNSLEKLFEHDNHGNSRIVYLYVFSDQNYKFIFTGKYHKMEFFVITTIRANFKMVEQKKYILFLNELEKLFSQMSLPWWNTVGINACLPLMAILSFIAVRWFFIDYLDLPFDMSTLSTGAFIIAMVSVVTPILGKPIWQFIFTPVHFSWGGEVKRLKRANTILAYILGIITGILVNGLSDYFFKG